MSNQEIIKELTSRDSEKDKHLSGSGLNFAINLMQELAALSSSTNGWVKFDASDNKTFPRLGDCYNVVWDMEDGGLPTTTTMEWDAINNRWRDVIGTPEADQIILYWQPLPPPPKQ